MHVATVALVAVASSIATVGALELLRGARPARAIEPETEPAATRVLYRATGNPDRLAELERRIAALELDRVSLRTPVSPESGPPPSQDDLRNLVLELLAAEREAGSHSDELEREQERRKEREFDARYHALMFAKEHGLADWQRERFAQLFIETAERTAEIEGSIDPLIDDPEAVEARWIEFDEWVDRRERELTLQVDPELYRKLYGDS